MNENVKNTPYLAILKKVKKKNSIPPPEATPKLMCNPVGKPTNKPINHGTWRKHSLFGRGNDARLPA